jgi:hypothetical protein
MSLTPADVVDLSNIDTQVSFHVTNLADVRTDAGYNKGEAFKKDEKVLLNLAPRASHVPTS